MPTVDVNIDSSSVPIPKVFNDLVNFVRNDLNEEGIFRREGSKVKQRILVKTLDNGCDIPEETTVIEACAVLKVFLRNIPERVITKESLPFFLEAGELRANSTEALYLCVLLLPLENLYLLTFLMQFFKEVVANSKQNKMNSYNVAAVIAPNIFPPSKSNNLDDQRQIIEITKTLIEHANVLGVVPATILNKLEALHLENAQKKSLCACLLILLLVPWDSDQTDSIMSGSFGMYHS